jgi:hypothetical protein
VSRGLSHFQLGRDPDVAITATRRREIAFEGVPGVSVARSTVTKDNSAVPPINAWIAGIVV